MVVPREHIRQLSALAIGGPRQRDHYVLAGDGVFDDDRIPDGINIGNGGAVVFVDFDAVFHAELDPRAFQKSRLGGDAHGHEQQVGFQFAAVL